MFPMLPEAVAVRPTSIFGWKFALVIPRLPPTTLPVTFVERQIAHAWGAGVTASIGIFIIEIMLGLDVLTLTPILSIAAGMVFLFKAGTLSGWFYVAAALCFLGALPMAYFGPPISPLLVGVISAIGFFVPGLKYYRQRLRSLGE